VKVEQVNPIIANNAVFLRLGSFEFHVPVFLLRTVLSTSSSTLHNVTKTGFAYLVNH